MLISFMLIKQKECTSTTERKCRKRKPAGRTSESCAKSCNNEDELITDDIVCAIDNLKKDYTNVEVNFVIDTEPKNNKAMQTVSVEKTVIAAQLENKILRNSIITESDPTKNNNQGKRSCTTNRMSFQTIYREIDLLAYTLSSSMHYLNFSAVRKKILLIGTQNLPPEFVVAFQYRNSH